MTVNISMIPKNSSWDISIEDATATLPNAHRFDFNERVGAKANTMAKSVGSGGGFGEPMEAYRTGSVMSQAEVGSA